MHGLVIPLVGISDLKWQAQLKQGKSQEDAKTHFSLRHVWCIKFIVNTFC